MGQEVLVVLQITLPPWNVLECTHFSEPRVRRREKRVWVNSGIIWHVSSPPSGHADNPRNTTTDANKTAEGGLVANVEAVRRICVSWHKEGRCWEKAFNLPPVMYCGWRNQRLFLSFFISFFLCSSFSSSRLWLCLMIISNSHYPSVETHPVKKFLSLLPYVLRNKMRLSVKWYDTDIPWSKARGNRRSVSSPVSIFQLQLVNVDTHPNPHTHTTLTHTNILTLIHTFSKK